MKYAILSTDKNPDYYSLLPLVCYSWRKIGYEPVIIVFGDVPTLNIDARIMHYRGEKLQVKDSTMAQLSRLFAASLYPFFKPDDVLITGDADMVIAKDIFTHDVSQGRIVSYGYDLTGRSELPICYVKTTAAMWKILMGDFVIPEKAYSERWEDYWSVDQQLLTQRAHEYGMDKITFIDRGNDNSNSGLPVGRWDRFNWRIPSIVNEQGIVVNNIIDVHMVRNNWDAQIEVFKTLWPIDDYSFITKFKEALNESVR